jgi:hypothetical protein
MTLFLYNRTGILDHIYKRSMHSYNANIECLSTERSKKGRFILNFGVIIDQVRLTTSSEYAVFIIPVARVGGGETPYHH